MDAYAQLLADGYTAGCQRLVVAAAVVAHGRVLVLRRAATDFSGGIDELPSGGVEEGEAIPDAIARELHEATGLTLAAIVRPLPAFDYRSGSGQRRRQLRFHVSVPELGPIRLAEPTSLSLSHRHPLLRLKGSRSRRRCRTERRISERGVRTLPIHPCRSVVGFTPSPVRHARVTGGHP